MFWYDRMSASWRNTSPGSRMIASRITRSCVTSLPEISILLTMAGCPSLIAQRRSTTGLPSAPLLGPAQPQEAGAVPAFERKQLLQLFRREAPVPHDLERARAVRLPFAHAHHERRLAGRVVHDQRVVEHLEIDVAPVAVEFGEPLLQVLAQLFVVELTGAEPPEPFGPGLHLADQLIRHQVRVALDLHARHRDPPALVHVEDDPLAGRIGLIHVDHLHLGEVVALRAVQGVDAPAGPGHGGGVDRPAFGQLGLVAHAALGDAAHAAHGPLDKDGALVQPHDEELAPARGVLRHPDVVVLARRVQGLDGALHVAVAQRLARGEAALLDRLLAIDPAEPDDNDGVGGDGGGGARRLALSARETRGEHGRTHTDDGGKLADHAFEPESARNANRSLSGAASTSTSSPRANSPTRIFSESGSSTYF